MPTVYDVPADALIEHLAKYLKSSVEQVKPPPWAFYAKTGAHKEKPPENPDWWYLRSASLLRRLYIFGPMGVSRLRKVYGGRKRFPMRRAHSVRAGGSPIRKALQQLEQAKFVSHSKKGRILTNEGKSLLDRMAAEVYEVIKPQGVA
ncbi:MAG: 30S ribosomal protein S19e [Thermoproteota archaeon]